MNPVQLVVLDVAGTTVRDDDMVNRCLREALASEGVVVTRDETNTVMGLAKPVAIVRLVSLRRGAPPQPAETERIHAAFQEQMIHFYATDPAVKETPDATRVMDHLRRSGLKLALDSGFNRPILDIIVRRMDWDHGLLDTTVASDEVARGRPHPDLIFEAMRRTRVVSGSAVVKVGDAPADLRSGMAAGCALVIGVTCGTHTREELARHPHSRLIDSLAELPRLLGK